MRTRNLIIALMAGGFTLATLSPLSAGAQPRPTPPARDEAAPTAPAATYNSPGASDQDYSGKLDANESNLKSSRLIGMTVEDESGARLGKVQDVIVSMSSDTAPFAIVKYGGTLGFHTTRVAVPLSDLKLADSGKALTIAASKEQFESASTSPSGAWAPVANESWTRNIDRYYGQPAAGHISRFERQEMSAPNEGREPVRTPDEQKGATLLKNQPPATVAEPARPAEGDLRARATEIVSQEVGPASAQNIQVSVDGGVVTLKGHVANAAQKRTIEERIQALGGVQKVDDQITSD